MFKSLKLILVVGFMLATGAAAQDLKIGFVNVARLLEKAPQADQAKKALENEFSPRSKRIEADQSEITKLEEKLARDAAVMSDTERSKMERDILSKKRETKRAQEEFREDFNLRRNEELGKLHRQALEAIRSIAQEEKYDLLLTDGVVYASEPIDVTIKVQEKLKDSYPN